MIEIRDKSDCSGCSACVHICSKQCIDFVEDNEGFLYPKVNIDKCSDCGLCEKVCPVIAYRKLSKEAYPQIFAAKNNDKKTLLESSSGGLFSALSTWIIEQEGIVYGACFDDHFKVIHCGSDVKNGCFKFHGSKYVQSYLGNTFVEIKKMLIGGRKVLFTGVPCQVAGLKLFLRKKFDNLYTVDLICHGVPSPKVFADYIIFAQRKKKISSINMRWKGNWDFSEMKLYYADNTSRIDMTWRELYAQAVMNRPSCHQCEFTHFNRPGDVSIADYWGIRKSHPKFYDSKGVSLLLVNSFKGESLLNGIRNSVELLLSDKDKCVQPRLKEFSKPSPYRDDFWKDYGMMDFESLIKKYYSNKYRMILFCKRAGRKFINNFIR